MFMSETSANYQRSVDLLTKNGLVALTYQKALVLMDQNPDFKEQLKGKWFWIAGDSLHISGYYTFDDSGELIKTEEINPEKAVNVHGGSYPSYFVVGALNRILRGGARFGTGANIPSQTIAPVVVGYSLSSEATLSELDV